MSDVQKTLDERGARYGDFSDHAAIAQELQDVMRSAPNDKWDTLSPVQKQALTVIADKIARILTGDPNYADSWHDIQGYARLAEERLPKPEPDIYDAVAARRHEDALVTGWHTWDCHKADAARGPTFDSSRYRVDAVKFADGSSLEVNGGVLFWDTSVLPRVRIVAYSLKAYASNPTDD